MKYVIFSLILLPIFSLKASTCDFYSLEIPVMVDHPNHISTTLTACPQSQNLMNAAGETLLFTAVRYNSSHAMKTLLDLGANPNHLDKQGQSALFLANHLGQAQELVNAGARLGQLDFYGRTAFSAALENKNFELADFLLDQLYVIQERDLQWASDHYHRDILHYLAIEAKKETLSGVGAFFRSFFFYEEEYRQLAKQFIEKGADLNQATTIGSQKSLLQSYIDEYVLKTTLFDRYGSEAIEFLVTHKADVNQYYPRKGKSLVGHLLSARDHEQNIEFLKLFFDHGLKAEQLRGDKTLLMELAFFSKTTLDQQNRIQSYAAMIADQAKTLNTQDSLGQTALHHAIRWENVPLAKTLVEKGINIGIKNHAHQTALEYAYERLEQLPDHSNRLQLVEIIRLLLN